MSRIMNTFTYIALMALLLLMSAFFSAAETAYSSLNRTRLKTLAEKGVSRAILANSLAEQYDKLISTVLIGNNIVNIALASMGTVFFVRLCGNAGATLSTAVITVAVLIFGEVSPKSLAKDNPESFAMFAAPFMKGLVFLLTPLNFLFSLWKSALSKLFRIKENAPMSQEELLMLVDEVQQEGSIDTNEGSLLRNAIEFSELRAGDILIHRVDVDALPVDAPKEEISRVFGETQYSRLPLYEENIDRIVGILHQKDFYVNGAVSSRPVKELMSPPVFVMENEKISTILKQLQKKKSHIAVVLDEYGGTLGIVTMEDILEELVGEIWDEHDEIVENFRALDDGAVRVDCAVSLDDFREYFGVDLNSDVATVSGWVMEKMEKLPSVGEAFQSDGLAVTVTALDAHRVQEIDVKKISD